MSVSFNSCDLFLSKGEIDADDPSIYFCGRVDKRDPKKIRFDWPGVYLKAKFEGTSVAVKLNDSSNTFNVFLDGKFLKVITPNDSTKVYSVADSLADTLHTIKITKRTEASFGQTEFNGFLLDKGCELIKTNFKAKRSIEFIGDSFVAGFGNEGKSPECEFSAETENNYLGFGPVLARRFESDYAVVAVSGIGIMRNFGDRLVSDNPMPAVYNRVCYNDTLIHNDKNWKPDAVVIRIGKNDFWQRPYPSIWKFREAYLDFLKEVRAKYPESHIFTLCGPTRNDPSCYEIYTVVNSLIKLTKDSKLHFVKLDVKLKRPDDFGCQWHPNVIGHKKIADFLEPIIKEKLNW